MSKRKRKPKWLCPKCKKSGVICDGSPRAKDGIKIRHYKCKGKDCDFRKTIVTPVDEKGDDITYKLRFEKQDSEIRALRGLVESLLGENSKPGFQVW